MCGNTSKTDSAANREPIGAQSRPTTPTRYSYSPGDDYRGLKLMLFTVLGSFVNIGCVAALLNDPGNHLQSASLFVSLCCFWLWLYIWGRPHHAIEVHGMTLTSTGLLTQRSIDVNTIQEVRRWSVLANKVIVKDDKSLFIEVSQGADSVLALMGQAHPSIDFTTRRPEYHPKAQGFSVETE